MLYIKYGRRTNMNIFKRLMLKSKERKALDDYMRIEYKNDYRQYRATGLGDYRYIRDSYYNRSL